MLNSQNKKAGFFGTFLFHLGLLIICFFSSIGYTSVEIPVGIEIEFIPYQDLNVVENSNSNKIENKSNESIINNDDFLEETVLQTDKSILIPNNEDSLTISEEIEKEPSFTLSPKLKNALSIIKENTINDDIEILDPANEDLEVSTNSNTNIKNSQDAYQLANRLAVQKVKPVYLCKEFGTVVVRVWVNQKGVTIKAEPGIRGTTDSSPCLLKEAKNAALQTTWTPYFNAPEVQIGQITYNFRKY